MFRHGSLIFFHLPKEIFSYCFLLLFQYNSLEEAQNAREALDGCRWPSSNPKTLSVRFGRQDEVRFFSSLSNFNVFVFSFQFEFSKTNDLPPDQMSNGKKKTNSFFFCSNFLFDQKRRTSTIVLFKKKSPIVDQQVQQTKEKQRLIKNFDQ